MNRLERTVEDYLKRLMLIRSSGGGTNETSYYAALENLLNAIGSELKPKVFCVAQMQEQGAGHPDFGLFAAAQVQKGEPKDGQVPERGVVEVKGTGDDTWLTAQSDQVSKYWSKYRLVLVTNYRDFLLVGEDAEGRVAKQEQFRLANTEAEFWSRAETPRKYASEIAQSFGEYLRRVATQSVSLTDPKDVAWFLASYARDALARVEDASDVAALQSLRSALEEALGVEFKGNRGNHFFHSSLVQTLFYGVFSAWVLWSKESRHLERRFDWKTAVWHLRVPMIRALYQQVSDPRNLSSLNLVEVLDWAGATLNRVDRRTFFANFKDEHAVQYFYEPFLNAFDPDLRKQLGVWYTPREVVEYMVARVDKALKDDLGVADGLGADNVYILDPCTGTGSFLAEVLRRISSSLEDKGFGALKGPMVRKAATERVFGFEIMPAPFVVAHLQIGLVLNDLGAPLAEDGSQRAGVYLTNALTGWEPTDKEKQDVAFPEMVEERDRANEVKRDHPILVILGNPPYNGFADVAVDEERTLSNAYRAVPVGLRSPEGQGLNDLYVRFFRMAERRIAEITGQGIICYISNYSWLDGLSFPGMRHKFLDSFDAIRIDNLNGDKYKTGKIAPDGTPDPSIFSTAQNREGIQVGTAIATLIRKPSHEPARDVQFRDLWGQHKLSGLIDSKNTDPDDLYTAIEPRMELGLPFSDIAVLPDYIGWPFITELMPSSYPGVKTSRDNFLVDVDRESLEDRLYNYFDNSIPDQSIQKDYPNVMAVTSSYDGPVTRNYLIKRGIIKSSIVRYAYRPFDSRWLYWEAETNLLDRKRLNYSSHIFAGNMWITSAEKLRRDEDKPQAIVMSDIGSLHLIERGANCFPMYLREHSSENDTDTLPTRPNLTESARKRLESLGSNVEELFFHIAAILHSPLYRAENAGALRMDWPRIPMPTEPSEMSASASLGRELANLLNTGALSPGVTEGGLRSEMKVLGVPATVGAGASANADLVVTAGWGHTQRNGIVMPGQGRVARRDYAPEEIQAINAGAGPLKLTPSQMQELLGETTVDVYLNDTTFWSNVPLNVWEYKLGGYQVIKKWLSYREQGILERPLMLDEVQHVSYTVRRIAAILLMSPALDDSYRAVRTP